MTTNEIMTALAKMNTEQLRALWHRAVRASGRSNAGMIEHVRGELMTHKYDTENLTPFNMAFAAVKVAVNAIGDRHCKATGERAWAAPTTSGGSGQFYNVRKVDQAAVDAEVSTLMVG